MTTTLHELAAILAGTPLPPSPEKVAADARLDAAVAAYRANPSRAAVAELAAAQKAWGAAR